MKFSNSVVHKKLHSLFCSVKRFSAAVSATKRRAQTQLCVFKTTQKKIKDSCAYIFYLTILLFQAQNNISWNVTTQRTISIRILCIFANRIPKFLLIIFISKHRIGMRLTHNQNVLENVAISTSVSA